MRLIITLLLVMFVGCNSPKSPTATPDGGITADAVIPLNDAGTPIPERDSGVINSCPEPTEESCQTDVFNDCVPREGTNGATLLRGTIIERDTLICDGDVLIDKTSKSIICVGEDCSNEPLASEASIVCADIILPGLIDPHNHMSYNTLPPWRSGGRLFDNRNQWRSEIGPDLYDARPPRNDAIAARYSELRLLLSGTTSVHKAEDTRSSHSHVRNIDRADDAHGLGYGDNAFRECVFPFTSSCSDQPNYSENTDIPERAFVAHVAEGIDATSQEEFNEFSADSRLGAKTSIIHCTACNGAQFNEMATTGTKLIWSPQSNIVLYGQTTDVATALRMNVTVALGPDWTPSGTMNMLTEAKCAKQVSETHWDNMITNKQLVQMMTVNAAKALGVADQIGSLEEGKLADILLISGDRRQPYAAVVEASTTDVRGVFIDGMLQLGDQDIFNSDIARNEFCEMITLCDTEKVICVKDIAGEPNRFDRADWARFGFYDIVNYVETIVQNQKPAGLSPELDYAYVVHPLFECLPTFDCIMGNDYVSGTPSVDDADGDGITNDADNCPNTFNPEQDNFDSDERGDACDPCPWSFPDCPCQAPSGPDRDGDGVLDASDNCPATPNMEQEDADNDGLGDACDLCPQRPISSTNACPVTISRVKRGEVPADEFVEVEGTVTGIYGAHLNNNSVGSFFIQAGESMNGFDGLFVYMGNRDNQVSIPEVGTRVRVSGIAGDFFGQIQLSNVTKIDTVTRSVILPSDQVLSRLDGIEAELDSELICLYDLTVADVAPEPGPGDSAPTYEFLVQDEDAAYSILVNDALYRADSLPSLGTYFERICGVYHLANGAYKIEPRDGSDLDTGPSRIVGVGPIDSFLRTNQKRVPRNQNGRKLTIELSKPAPEGGIPVGIESSASEILNVPNSLLIPEGMSRFPLVVESFDTTGLSTLTVTDDISDEAFVVDVGVLSNQPPSTMTLALSADAVLEGQTLQLSVNFDTPVLQPTQVTFLVSHPEAVQIPAAVMVQRDQTSAIVSLQALERIDNLFIEAKASQMRAGASIDILATQPKPFITELNADMAGLESLEFIELYNPSRLDITTEGLSIALINGGNNEAYQTHALDTPVLEWDAQSFLVIGDPGVEALLPDSTLFIPWSSRSNDHDIQNGNPDGVRLNLNDERLDSLSYGGIIENVTEGAEGAPDDLNTEESTSISRCPYDVDTNNNATDFRLAPASPGSMNTCEN